jgi:hypothetical protein
MTLATEAAARTPSAGGADPPDSGFAPETARYVAGLYLAGGLAPARVRAYDGEAGHRGMFLAIADAMDELLAGGFDPDAFMESLRSAPAGSPVAA